MSTRRGGQKKGRPAHQNTFAFRHNKNSKRTQQILAAPTTGLCRRCREIVEWRKRYRKYKPLSRPHQCSSCKQKSVVVAYRTVCDPCARKSGVCSKCLETYSAAAESREALKHGSAAGSGGGVERMTPEQEAMAAKLGLDVDNDTLSSEEEVLAALGYLDVRIAERDRRRLLRLFEAGKIKSFQDLVKLARGGKAAASELQKQEQESAPAEEEADYNKEASDSDIPEEEGKSVEDADEVAAGPAETR